MSSDDPDVKDFTLRLFRDEDETLRVHLLSWPHGTEKPFKVVKKFAVDELPEARIDELREALRQAAIYGRSDVGSRLDQEDLGTLLKEVLFTPEMWAEFLACLPEQHSRGRLRLQLLVEPSDLAAWPWEYLHDTDLGFLNLLPNVTIVRISSLRAEPLGRRVRKQLRVLLVSSNFKPDHSDREVHELWLPKLDEEVVAIRGAFERVETLYPRRSHLEEFHNPMPVKLREKLQDKDGWDVVIYLGHAGPKGLVLNDGHGGRADWKAEELTEAVKAAGTRLVVLNACETLGIGTALTLADAGLAVLATHFPQSDVRGMVFGVTMWAVLAQFRTLHEALATGRDLLAEGDGVRNLAWGNTALILPPHHDGLLFQSEEEYREDDYAFRVATLHRRGKATCQPTPVRYLHPPHRWRERPELAEALREHRTLVIQTPDLRVTLEQTICWALREGPARRLPIPLRLPLEAPGPLREHVLRTLSALEVPGELHQDYARHLLDHLLPRGEAMLNFEIQPHHRGTKEALQDILNQAALYTAEEGRIALVVPVGLRPIKLFDDEGNFAWVVLEGGLMDRAMWGSKALFEDMVLGPAKFAAGMANPFASPLKMLHGFQSVVSVSMGLDHLPSGPAGEEARPSVTPERERELWMERCRRNGRGDC